MPLHRLPRLRRRAPLPARLPGCRSPPTRVPGLSRAFRTRSVARPQLRPRGPAAATAPPRAPRSAPSAQPPPRSPPPSARPTSSAAPRRSPSRPQPSSSPPPRPPPPSSAQPSAPLPEWAAPKLGRGWARRPAPAPSAYSALRFSNRYIWEYRVGQPNGLESTASAAAESCTKSA
eukprot:COSAG04_NODE_241_length_19022_cov_38.409819_2_plen_175_part_00